MSPLMVGIKSFSITRLKLKSTNLLSGFLQISWNQKFLDYEIETFANDKHPVVKIGSWNQKFLDYEIETIL